MDILLYYIFILNIYFANKSNQLQKHLSYKNISLFLIFFVKFTYVHPIYMAYCNILVSYYKITTAN